MNATITYDGSNLTLTITDPTANKTFTKTYTGYNIPQLVGGNTAYVGFTGGTGGLTATQDILTWTYKSTAPSQTQVNLAGAFNGVGIMADGTPFSNGLDSNGQALSGNLLGTTATWSGTTFSLGAAGASDVICGAGQAIALPAGFFSSLNLLAVGVSGNQPNQVFTVTYTDGTTSTFTQSVSDWQNPQNYAGEATAVNMPYANRADGTKVNVATNIYGYTFKLDPSRGVKSLTLQNNPQLKLLALTLSS